MRGRIVVVVFLGAMLAACGGHRRKDVSVDFLLRDEKVLLDEMAWCGNQPEPENIEGCRNAAEAVAIDSDLAATVPEPLPNKGPGFFKAVADAEAAKEGIRAAEAELQGDQRRLDDAQGKMQALHAGASGGGAVEPARERAAKHELRAWQDAVARDHAELTRLNAAIAAVPQNALAKVRDEASWCAEQNQRTGLGAPEKTGDATSCAAVPAAPGTP